jgi:phosphatidylinositol glycan class V
MLRCATSIPPKLPCSIFTLASFAGIYLLLDGLSSENSILFYGYMLLATLCFTAGSAIRSNGAVLAGFLLFAFMYKIPFVGSRSVVVRVISWVAHAVAMLLLISLVFLPFLTFQTYAYAQYCDAVPSLLLDALHALGMKDVDGTGPERPWCDKLMQVHIGGIALVATPNLYGFVQQRYWGVGFLTYFQPNSKVLDYLIAMPMALLCVDCLRQLAAGRLILYAKLRPIVRRLVNGCLYPITMWTVEEDTVAEPEISLWFALIVHWAFLTVFALLFMYVQVITRFVSSSPAVYLYLCWRLTMTPSRWLIRAWLAYCVIYHVVGTTMFSTFLPWT